MELHRRPLEEARGDAYGQAMEMLPSDHRRTQAECLVQLPPPLLPAIRATPGGTRCEQAACAARPRRPTPTRSSRAALQPAAAGGRLPVRNRLWARVWLIPLPGPDRTGNLHCLSPPAA